ncbi:MAG TPA: hypothetical protein VGB15_16615 [Longimicrobium sp.]|jgi:hypothetical protein
MIPERPAGEGGPLYRDPASSRVQPGVKPALLIFGGAAVLEAVAIAGFNQTLDGRFIVMGMLVAAAALIVAIVAGARLPKGRRWPFVLVGVACILAATVIFAGTCAMVFEGA